ncbi:hypothetical protein EI94DRAFT_1710855 [Lactarius quietus]|nr:hypothetical protein EI94DRAFT_1710855 [Lactarius quietus]
MPPKPKPPTLPSTTQHLAEVFATATRAIEEIISSNPESREPIQKLIDTFLTSPTIAKLQGAAQAPSPSELPLPSLLEDVKSIKYTLAALQKVILPGAKAGKPPTNKNTESAPSAPNTRAKGKIPTPTFASAAALPPCPSIVVSLHNLTWNKGRPSPANLCTGINGALEASVITFQTHTPFPLPSFDQTIPTGVTTENGARTLDECHAALVSDNPSYATLNITQKPSWVCDPNSYPEGAISLLVVAFEDPDGSLAPGDHALLSAIFKKAIEDTDTPCDEGPETSKNMKDNDGRQKSGGGKGRDRPTRTPH